MAVIRKQIMTIAVAGCVIGLAFAAGAVSFAQPGQTGGIGKTGGRAGGNTRAKGPDSGIGKTGAKAETVPGFVTPLESASVPTGTKPRATRVEPRESLTIYTTPKATILLSRTNGAQASSSLKRQATQEGIASFPSLAPGIYTLDITQKDFSPISQQIEIKPKKPLALSAPLESKFGTFRLLLGKEASADVRVKLNGQELKLGEFELEGDLEDNKAFKLVRPVGVYRIEISKPGYTWKSWENVEIISDSIESFNVKSGRPQKNLLAINLERPTATLSVKSVAGARVYINNEDKGLIGSKGDPIETLLVLGEYKLRVELFGYVSAERTVRLALDNSRVIEDVSLVSLVETSPGVSEFDAKKNEWYPARPAEWKLTDGVGVTVKGDRVALLKNNGMPNRDFMVFGDFTLIFYLRLDKGKGASWVVRARDEKNYYLFELTAPDSRRERKLVFYRCDNGKLSMLDDCIVTADLEKPGGQFIIRLVGSGGKFWHCLQDNNTASGRNVLALGKTFSDYTFDRGGVGLRAINGSEFYVFEHFSVQLGAIVNEQCESRR